MPEARLLLETRGVSGLFPSPNIRMTAGIWDLEHCPWAAGSCASLSDRFAFVNTNAGTARLFRRTSPKLFEAVTCPKLAIRGRLWRTPAGYTVGNNFSNVVIHAHRRRRLTENL